MNTPPTDAEIAEARALPQAKGRDIHLITVSILGEDFHAIAFAPPKPEYARFLKMISPKDVDNVTMHKAQDQLVKDSTLWPDDAELVRNFDQKALLSSKLAGEIMKLAGDGATVTLKKL